MVDMYLALVMHQRRTISQVPLAYRDAVRLDLIALGLNGNGYPIPTSTAPVVSADDVNNLIIGIDATMEYAIDTATVYTPYTVPFDLSGEHTVNVRVSEVVFVSYASLPTTLTFTLN